MADTLAGTGDNRNVTFALIILQRRLASSIRAIHRSLENRRDRLAALRDLVGADPDLLEEARRGEGVLDELSEDAPELERWEAEERALRLTLARNLDELEAEIAILTDLAAQALAVEEAGPERKLDELRRVIQEIDLVRTGEKLLIFTEAKDTLDYLAENLKGWGLSVTSIDGTMAPTERYRAEQEFRDPGGAQVMVATEAAGEGINLQFCHLMINYDLPWNPTAWSSAWGVSIATGSATRSTSTTWWPLAPARAWCCMRCSISWSVCGKGWDRTGSSTWWTNFWRGHRWRL
jgi:hypothetical protein